MFLKRLTQPDPQGGTPRITGVRVLRAKRVQHFTEQLVMGAVIEGWLTISGDVLTIKSDPPVVYRIVRRPGAYCCHCGAQVGDDGAQRPGDDGITEGRRHVVTMHGETPSPDPLNPAGYRIERHFTGVLVGEEVEALSPADAAALEAQVRGVLIEKLQAKYGNTRQAALDHRAAKLAGKEG